MKKVSIDIMRFFQEQSYVVVSTIDRDGSLHNSCKGLVKINSRGLVYLLDLYKGKTYENLKNNTHISITAVDEHKFVGYCLKGKAKEIRLEKVRSEIINEWEKKIASRITHRLLKNIQGERGHSDHPEASLPNPEYLIVMSVKKVVDLTPQHIKQKSTFKKGGNS